ncbi:hypothetical protein ACH5RR_040205 [Cinchona calisaya]|uniref:Uncharacterized protein n=1 Tax=Cinchona calisaya TaxID=153742 RepID=A0ABD2XS04_9GENT
MAGLLILSFVFLLSFSFSSALFQETKAIPIEITSESSTFKQKDLQTYIVHVSLPSDSDNSVQFHDLESWYHSFLPKTSTGLNDASRMVHSYRKVITGFAARLSAEEVKEMEKKEGFVSARPQKILALHTTHSPDFLGLHLNHGVWLNSTRGKGVIIGILDTGIKPDHPSFSDDGMPPPPPRWKGKCEFNNGTICNNKLIGARNFISKEPGLPPLDDYGHGTHTASTAAGNFVQDANVFGNANGIAVGMAPLAHLAIYRVCNKVICQVSDVLAAMDAAIEDGVDVLSLSLGHGILESPEPFFEDNMAIGAFTAIQNGVFVSCSAGNSGPLSTTMSNEAPWILTVGASTTDRSLRATALLGNNVEFDGEAVFQPEDFPTTLFPLVYAGMNGILFSALCAPRSLKHIDVRGKVVLCKDGFFDTHVKGKTVKDAGGVGMILMNSQPLGDTTLAEVHAFPTIRMSFTDGEAIKAYINSTSTPKAAILFKGTVIGAKKAPAVAGFSSRGPNYASPGILKPDIIGPGVNILAAWSSSVENITNTTSTFHVVSGTSMSCPHLSGVAALLKAAHPDWSPAAIKSAIMTSANVLNLYDSLILDERKLTADIFAVGAGHVSPSRAIDPGLIYDIKPDDYIPYLCGLGYKDKNIATIIGKTVKCSTVSSISEAQLNYPSFSIQLLKNATQIYTRTVKNVGESSSPYYVEIGSISEVDVSVQPSMLNFTEVNQEMTYQISFTRSATSIHNSIVQGAITWVCKEHRVRSPIAVILE